MERLFDIVHKKYALPKGKSFNLEDFDRTKELLALQLLMEEMERVEAPEEEMKKVLEYIAVVIDAQKYLLDWERAYKECEIDSFIEKYVEENE